MHLPCLDIRLDGFLHKCIPGVASRALSLPFRRFISTLFTEKNLFFLCHFILLPFQSSHPDRQHPRKSPVRIICILNNAFCIKKLPHRIAPARQFQLLVCLRFSLPEYLPSSMAPILRLSSTYHQDLSSSCLHRLYRYGSCTHALPRVPM